MSKLSRLIGIFLATISLLLMSSCGGPVPSSKTSKSKSSSSQGNDDYSSNSAWTNHSSSNDNINSSYKSNSTHSSTSKKMTPTFNQTKVDSIDPGWQLEKSQTIHFPDHDVIVAVIAIPPYMSDAKLIVVQFDSASGSWLTKWSRNITPNGYGKLQSVLVTQPNSEGTALALISADEVATPVGAVALALKIDDSGTCILEEIFYSMDFSIVQQGNILIINGSRKLGMRTLSLQGRNYIDHRTPPSQLSPVGSVKVTFRLDNDGNVIAAQQSILNMKVGQAIAFVPADDRTKDEFDQGNIEIYTDWGNGILGTSVADLIGSGNSYKFDKNGTIQFFLIADKKWTDGNFTPNTKPIPTFIVHVQS